MRSIRFLIATILLATSAAAACSVDNWRYLQSSTSFIEIQGTTTCAVGVITIRAFDGEGIYLGNAETMIRDHAFNALLEGVAPKKMSITYAINPIQQPLSSARPPTFP